MKSCCLEYGKSFDNFIICEKCGIAHSITNIFDTHKKMVHSLEKMCTEASDSDCVQYASTIIEEVRGTVRQQ